MHLLECLKAEYHHKMDCVVHLICVSQESQEMWSYCGHNQCQNQDMCQYVMVNSPLKQQECNIFAIA